MREETKAASREPYSEKEKTGGWSPPVFWPFWVEKGNGDIASTGYPFKRSLEHLKWSIEFINFNLFLG